MKKFWCTFLFSLLLLLLCGGAGRAFPHISFFAHDYLLEKRYMVSTSVADKAMILEWFLIQGEAIRPYSYDSCFAIYQALPGSRDPETARMVQLIASVLTLVTQKRYDEAIERAHKVIATYEAQHDTMGMSIALRELPALIIDAQNNIEGRLLYYAPKAEYYKRKGQLQNLAACYHRLAGYYLRKGNLNEAISHYLKAGELYKEFWPEWHANELYCVGSCYEMWGNTERARYYFRLLDESFSEGDKGAASSRAYYDLADLEITEGRLGAALHLLDTAIQRNRYIDIGLYAKKIALKTAEVYIAQGRLDTAAIILRCLVRQTDSFKIPVYSYYGYFELDHTAYLYHKARGDVAAASASLEAALDEAKIKNVNTLKLKYQRELMQWYNKKSPVLALKYAREYIALSDSITKANAPNNVAYYESVMQETEANKSISALKEERRMQAIELKSRKKILVSSSAALGLFAALTITLFYTNRRKTRTARIIRKEKQRSDALLLNILPAEVAEELKSHGASEARQYDEVSVLFTDFVDFTGTAEQLSPQVLVKELHECFSAFDAIIERNGLEKIKTVGDAYIAVCGLPVPDEGHAQKCVQAALEIKDFIEERKKRERVFEIRIGINSGPVVAGIVGVKKFAYDIWGDTVNTAARMEQHSEPGRINISQNTYELVKEVYSCSYRGKIAAKHKGEVEMYFVTANA